MRNGKFWEITSYVALGLLVLGQIVVGWNFWIGQGAFLVANIIYTVRCFAIEMPQSDKIKNSAMLAITLGLLIIKFF